MSLEFVRLVCSSWDCTLNPAGIIINTTAGIPNVLPSKTPFNLGPRSSIYLRCTAVMAVYEI